MISIPRKARPGTPAAQGSLVKLSPQAAQTSPTSVPIKLANITAATKATATKGAPTEGPTKPSGKGTFSKPVIIGAAILGAFLLMSFTGIFKKRARR